MTYTMKWARKTLTEKTDTQTAKQSFAEGDLQFSTATWSGTEFQASRTLEFTIPWNPYDKTFQNPAVDLGDIIRFYEDGKLLFMGVVTDRNKTDAPGAASYIARDFIHYLLKSNFTKAFHNITPAKVAKRMCKKVGMKTGKLKGKGYNIQTLIVEDKSLYDIIMRAYFKLYQAKGKRCMPVMDEDNNFCVILKGKDSGVTLDATNDVLGATYHDTADNMVNKVLIYNENREKTGKVKDKALIEKHGTYIATYKEEEGVNAKSAAKALLVGVTQEASIQAVGNSAARAGYAIAIREPALNLTGIFFISSDKHEFHDGIHTMELELVWQNKIEEGADEEDDVEEGD